jgi:hypothetical protein
MRCINIKHLRKIYLNKLFIRKILSKLIALVLQDSLVLVKFIDVLANPKLVSLPSVKFKAIQFPKI